MSKLQLAIPGGGVVDIDAVYTAPVVPPVVEVPPVVVPPIVIPPASGVFSQPNTIQEMYEVRPGEWMSKDAFRSTVAALHFNLGAIRPGGRVVSKFAKKAKYPLDGENQKVFRIWAGKVGGYPNFYGGNQVDGGFIFNTEKVEAGKGISKWWKDYPDPTGDWVAETWDLRYSSAPGKADGAILVKVGKQVVLEAKGWLSNTVALPTIMNVVCLQHDVSNGTLPAGSFVSFKDIEITVER